MKELLRDLRLDELREFLMSGHPTILTQIIILNVAGIILFIVRRMAGRHFMFRNASATLQWILLFSNVAVLMEQQWIPLAQDGIHAVMWKYRNFIPYT